MTRPHIAAIAEDGWNYAFGGVLRARGWRHLIVTHAGYANEDEIRVLARVLLAPDDVRRDYRSDRWQAAQASRRGWRNFFVVDAVSADVTIRVGDIEHHTTVDRSGYVDVRIPNPGLEPGWREVTLQTPESVETIAPIMVVDPAATVGLISDIDDTVLRTYLPRPLVAAYNTFLLDEQSRRPVRHMASFYSRQLTEHRGAPVFYVSTGAWNTAGMLTRFLATHGFPAGPLLLTDWGPTNTGWFRSGADHKRACLATLAEDFPNVRWILVGDNGQRDPSLYGQFAREHPDRVLGVAIRTLPMDEQVLAHGTPTERPGQDQETDFAIPPGTFWVEGADGNDLAEKWWGSRARRSH